MNTAELLARFDPEYQMRLQRIQQASELAYFKANADMQIARYKAEREDQRETIRSNTAISIENKRGENALTLAEKEHQNKLSQMQYLSEREDQREVMKGQNALAITELDHKNQLARMQADLQNKLTLAGFDSSVLAMQKIMDEDNKRRASMLTQIENRTQLRGEVFKMLAGAVIQEKIAQKQHAREVEKMKLQNSLAEQFEEFKLKLATLLDEGRDDKAKAEIDRFLKDWGMFEV